MFLELEDEVAIYRRWGIQKQTGHKKRRTWLGKEYLFLESMGHYVKFYPDVYTAHCTAHKLYQTEKSKQLV